MFDCNLIHLPPPFLIFLHTVSVMSQQCLEDLFKEDIITRKDEAVCDGAWVVIQRRKSADVSFNRPWSSYREGFGVLSTNFWWGLKYIHQFTSGARCKVRFEFTFNGTSYYAEYSSFSVAGESDNYRLSISGYSGNAGDSMAHHDGMEFSTPDRDNDKSSKEGFSCARHYESGWWYNWCHNVNFNGRWGSDYWDGLGWYTTTGARTATSTEIKIRLL